VIRPVHPPARGHACGRTLIVSFTKNPPFTPDEVLLLQDAIDDVISETDAHAVPQWWRVLQAKLHAQTGKAFPPNTLRPVCGGAQ
jgi:hypothetical protein